MSGCDWITVNAYIVLCGEREEALVLKSSYTYILCGARKQTSPSCRTGPLDVVSKTDNRKLTQIGQND